MNIFYLEELRINLLSSLNSEKAPINQLLLLNNFFSEVLEANDPNILEVFLNEFILKYSHSFKNLNAIGLDPLSIEPVIISAKDIIDRHDNESEINEIKDQYARIEKEIELVKTSLRGSFIEENKEILSFPVSIHQKNNRDSYGQIETFTLKIYKDSSLKENRFLIVPSANNLEKRFEDQINVAWEIALDYLKIYYKNPNEFHEVVLIFSHKYANIEGYSLGFAITLGFIQALFKFYNTSLSLTLRGNATFTGGFNSNKRVKSIGEKIIRNKIETVFYSPFNYFVLPDSDLITAKERLNQLTILHPNRKLKIISIQDFDDLINHRQIIRIEKAKIIDRSKKYILKNSVVISLFIIILFIVGFYYANSIDNNPDGFQIINQSVHIVNKHGKILWSTKQSFDHGLDLMRDKPYVQRICDIDDDGTNEVLLASEVTDLLDTTKNRKISCYNNLGVPIWQYLFCDSIETNYESFDTKKFCSFIVDIVKEQDRKVLVAISRHLYFPSAIYKLDVKTGKRICGTLWSQGHFNRGIVGDFNNDGNIEIFIGGINNGFESAFTLLLDYNKLEGQTPTISKYSFKYLSPGSFIKYILYSKTDICRYLDNRFNKIVYTHYDINSKEFLVNTDEGKLKQNIGLVYRFDQDFKSVETQIGDDLQFVRDSLVIKGLLSGPLTNDTDYSKNLINGIMEWDGEKFIKFNSK